MKLALGLSSLALVAAAACGTSAAAPGSDAAALASKADDLSVPTDPDAAFRLGRGELLAGRYLHAQLLFDQTATKFPAARAFSAFALAEQGELGRGLTLARQAHGDCKCAVTAFYRGVLAQRAGLLDEARASFEQVLAAVPTDAASLNNLGSLAYLREDFAAARGYTERGLAVAQSADDRAILTSNLAELDWLANDADLAEKRANLATAAAPDEPAGYLELALLYDLTGRHDDAVFLMREALSLDSHGATRRATEFVYPEMTAHYRALICEAQGDGACAAMSWLEVAGREKAGTLKFAPLAGLASDRIDSIIHAPAAQVPELAETAALR